jgi:hypothetical protein
MKKAVCLFFSILLFSVLPSFASINEDSLSGNRLLPDYPEKKTESTKGGFNIKLSPAFFWKTIGLELELPIGNRFSIGVNLFGKVGRTDGQKSNYKVNDQDFLKDGIRAELALKYYLKPTAPEGFYIQANFAYNQIVYSDGTTKPYSINTHINNTRDTSSSGTIAKPYPYSAGLGLGYQLVFIPKHLIANIMIGAQGNMDTYNNPFLSFYIAPSIGYKF